MHAEFVETAPHHGGRVAPGFEEVVPSSSATSLSGARSAPPSPRTGAARRWWTSGAVAGRPPARNRGTRTRWSSSTRPRRASPRWRSRSPTRAAGSTTTLRSRSTGPSFPERQGRRHRASAAQPRGGVGLDRRAAGDPGPERPRPGLSRARTAETGLGAGKTRHGYHAMTIGLYMQELIRHVDPGHRTLGRIFAEEMRSC